jgi:transposase-like protein
LQKAVREDNLSLAGASIWRISGYSGYRFPPEIIQRAIWLYVRFTLSFRDVEDLLAERGIIVSYETVRRSDVAARCSFLSIARLATLL